ncbi:MAG: UbiD family decarboxylase [Veillonellales bacterium]
MTQIPAIQQEGFDLQACIQFLQQSGSLVTVETAVSADHELAGVARKFEGKESVLFNKVDGYEYPVLTGLYWNRNSLAKIFGCPAEKLSFLFAEAVASWQKGPVAPVVLEQSPATEIVMAVPDLSCLPVPLHALGDGGHYFDCSVVIAKDPDTGVRNLSIHRMMVTGPRRMTMLMDVGRHLRDYYERAERRGKPLEITISNGIDPSVYIASVVPGAAAPIEADELGIASALLDRPVELVKSRTVEVEGVANAQFIIEAEILPHERENEGPFAEVAGYYANQDQRWVVNVKSISHRRSPIFQTLLPGKEVFNSVGLMGEANVFNLVSRQVPGITGVHLSHGGCGFYHAVVQIKKVYEGTQRNAILAAFAAFPPLKQVIVVDDDVDIYDADDVEWAMCTRFNPETDIVLVNKAFGHELNPVTKNGLTAKIGFDATAPQPRPKAYERVKFQTVDIANYKLKK